MQAEPRGAAYRRAWFVYALRLAWPYGETATFLGRVERHFAWPPRGGHGFGYDPVYTPAGRAPTYVEMAPTEKHAGSHQARAMAQLAAASFGSGWANPFVQGKEVVFKENIFLPIRTS